MAKTYATKALILHYLAKKPYGSTQVQILEDLDHLNKDDFLQNVEQLIESGQVKFLKQKYHAL